MRRISRTVLILISSGVRVCNFKVVVIHLSELSLAIEKPKFQLRANVVLVLVVQLLCRSEVGWALSEVGWALSGRAPPCPATKHGLLSAGGSQRAWF